MLMGVSKKVSKEIVKEKRKTHRVSQKQHVTNVLIFFLNVINDFHCMKKSFCFVVETRQNETYSTHNMRSLENQG